MAIPTLGAMIAAMGSPAEWGAIATSKLFWDDVNGGLGIGPELDISTGSTLTHALNIVGIHGLATGIHIWANSYYLSGRTHDADLYLWASEPYVSFSGCGIGNNIRTDIEASPYFNRIDTARGGSYIRLLDNQINFSVVNSSGTHSGGMIIKSTGIINMANLPTYIDNDAAATAGLAVGDFYKYNNSSEGIYLVCIRV